MPLLICVTGNVPEKWLFNFGHSEKSTSTHGAVIPNVQNRGTFWGLVLFVSCCNVIYLIGKEQEKLASYPNSLIVWYLGELIKNHIIYRSRYIYNCTKYIKQQMNLICPTSKANKNQYLNKKVQTFYLHINRLEKETAVTLVITLQNQQDCNLISWTHSCLAAALPHDLNPAKFGFNTNSRCKILH